MILMFTVGQSVLSMFLFIHVDWRHV